MGIISAGFLLNIIMTVAKFILPSQCLQVERANTKSNAVYKKRELKGKTTMSDDFELGGEDEMEPTSSVTFSM